MNVLIITDYNWDNFSIVSKRFGSLDKNSRLNCLYGKNLQNISNLCSRHELSLYRRSLNNENIEQSLCEIIEKIDYCIIFHNFLEYNTISKFVIDFCLLNKINFFVFSEHTCKYYYDNIISDEKFKKKCKMIKRQTVFKMEYNFKITKQIFLKDLNKDLSKSIKNLNKRYNKKSEERKETKFI
tara:strand:+ start:305 stop:853 length:549 start_codon:yes stop_codon:yes gene_type:complete